ncbi:MAG: MDR family MFS transporter [Verrucomicrobiaceae bacterium]
MNKHAKQNCLWNDLRALPGPYWVLFSGTLINRFGHFVMPFLALYLQREGYAPWVTAIALGAYGGGGLIAGFLGGYCADRWGRKPTIIVSCAGGALCMMLLSQAVGPWAIVVVSSAVGMFSAMYFPAASALLADLVPGELRVRAFGCQRLAVNLGFAVGMAVAGLMAEKSFYLLFVVDALTTSVLGIIILFGVPEVRKVSKVDSSWAPALREMRRNPAYLRAITASFMIAVVFWQLSSTWGLQVTLGGGFDESVFGWLMALNGIMVVLLELPLTSWTRKHLPIRVMSLGYALVGIGMGFNLMGANLGVLVFAMVVLTIGEMISLPIAHSYIAGLAPEEMRGRFMGVLGIAWNGATMVGPALGMALFSVWPDGVWLCCLALGVGAAWVIRPGQRE